MLARTGGNSKLARSRSPHLMARGQSRGVILSGVLPKGRTVQFFYESDAGKKDAILVRPKHKSGLWMLQSHGWLEGTLRDSHDVDAVDPNNKETWPMVVPNPNIHFTDREGRRPKDAAAPRRVLHVREPSLNPPGLSFAFVRWGGAYSPWMDQEEANDGDWGQYGSPPSDDYMASVVKLGVLAHPRLNGDEGGLLFDVEIFSIFVTSSKDVWNIVPAAPGLAASLRGLKRTLFWMLWPAEWEDTGDTDFACYVERQSYFAAMRACEAHGLTTGFPHPADQFELITSKSWMATLSLHPSAHLPAATLVTKGSVVTNVAEAAKSALKVLEHVRKLNPFPVGPDEPPAPSVINKDGVTKGVVKLGWSWENRFVVNFVGVAQLQERLTEMMTQPSCSASYCVVQEWVDFDFEMRLYLLPSREWSPGDVILPTRIECNAWGSCSGEGRVGTSRASFHKLSEEAVLEKWSNDREAWESGKQQAIHIGQFLLAWLLTANADIVPKIRLDFMMKRLGPGKARVYFGEYCEMGACCLGWTEGPPTTWRSALNAVLR
eukprot:TRINITY_DN74342_c0_g1_i1.p1 TRINITY_DN74342_c0_g1~~TRINITY_DN74342_c0_g1_i1.p1  ORF type:complete len:581 (+),score=57.64 TRINITY_DN74342_c0_g1_i1:105-1745(+)